MLYWARETFRVLIIAEVMAEIQLLHAASNGGLMMDGVTLTLNV